MARFTDVDVFLAVAEAGSFRGAAGRLDVSKSTVSRAITRLEKHLGSPMFMRDTTSVRLTDAGVAYRRGACRAAAALTQAEAAAREVTGEVTGVLTLTAPPALGPGTLAGVIADFLARHPELRIELVLTDRIVNPILDGVDIAIRTGRRLTDSSLKSRRLADVRIIAVAAPGVAAKIAERPATVPTVVFVHGTAAVHRYPLPPVPLQERLHVDDYLTLKDAAVHGVGVAVISDLLVRDELADGTLVRVLERWKLPTARVWAVYPSHGKLSAKTEGMLRALKEGFAP